MYTINDLQIFIITHNRADFLKDSIDCLLNQTIDINEITVLDNESLDNTEEVVRSYIEKKVNYIKTYGFMGNFKKAKELANKKYIMLFHDDDILHPKYLEFVVRILNKYRNISLITTRYTEFNEENIPSTEVFVNESYYYFQKQKCFAKYMYFREIIAYAPAVCRTEDLLSLDLDYKKFGKFYDWPFMVEIAKKGESVLFEDKNLFFVRRHSGQETVNITSALTIEQIINWDKLFYEAMGADDICSLIHYLYVYRFTNFLYGKYDAFLSEKDKIVFSKTDLYEKAKEMGIRTEGIKIIDWIFRNEAISRGMFSLLKKQLQKSNKYNLI